MELRNLIERSLENRVADLEKLVGRSGGNSNTSAPSNTKTSAQGTTSSTTNGSTPSKNQAKIKLGSTATVNKQKFTWDGSEWVDNAGRPATGLMKQRLMKSQGRDITGKTKKSGIIQRAKDYIGGKTPGLAQATRSDPKASLAKKAGATAAAAVGGAIGRALGSSTRSTQAPSNAPSQAPSVEPASQSDSGKKALPKPTRSEYTALQKRAIGGDAAAAKELVNRLSNAKAKNYDINDFANSIGAILKRSNIDPRLKTKLTTQARVLRTEAYQHLCKVLEASGITWEELGYKVLISESTADVVLLVSAYELSLQEIKTLAGV